MHNHVAIGCLLSGVLCAGDVLATQRVVLGSGLDALTRKIKSGPAAVVPSDPMDPVNSAVCSFQQNVQLHLARDIHELETLIGMSASATLNILVATATGTFAYDFTVDSAQSKVFLVFRAEAQSCSFRMKGPKFGRPDAAQLYRSEPERFRELFGDGFANVLTTGGTFFGVVAVDAGESRLRFGLSVELRASLLFMTFKKGWRKEFERIVGRYRTVDMSVLINGQPRPVASPDHMWQLYQEFTQTLVSERCQGPQSFRTCPYLLAKYESYNALAPTPQGDAALRSAAESLGEMQMHEDIVNELQHRIDRIAGFPELHHATEEGSTVETQVHAAASALQNYRSQLEQRMQTCRRAPFEPASCAFDGGSLMTTLHAMDVSLPRENPPRSCRYIQILREASRDGQFVVYMNGDFRKPYDVLCEGLDSSHPKMYLLLKRTSPASRHPRYNFCRMVDATKPGEGARPASRATVYSALLVREVTDDLLAVVPDQIAHVKTVGETIEHVDEYGLVTRVDQCNYGRPTVRAKPRRALLVGNIDLRHTPFVLDESTNWRRLTSEEGEPRLQPYTDPTATPRSMDFSARSVDLDTEFFYRAYDPVSEATQPWLLLRYQKSGDSP